MYQPPLVLVKMGGEGQGQGSIFSQCNVYISQQLASLPWMSV